MHIENIANDLNIKIGITWAAMNKIKQIWKSKIQKSTNVFFLWCCCGKHATYGSKCWTLTNTLSKNEMELKRDFCELLLIYCDKLTLISFKATL